MTVAVPDESKFEAFSLEQYLIETLQPCCNVQGKKKWKVVDGRVVVLN
jgi:hypothetical protein